MVARLGEGHDRTPISTKYATKATATILEHGSGLAAQAASASPGENILSIRSLSTHFFTPQGVIKAVNNVSIDVGAKEVVGIVGESGSGKSMTANSIMRVVPSPGKIVGGQIWFNGVDLLKLRDSEMREIRGAKIAICFQDPGSYLSPLERAGDQIAEVLISHRNIGKREAMKKAIELMSSVKIPSPETRANDYPHRLSGGMKQRVMIAMALALDPDIVILDEPTTALDVIVQYQILELLENLKKRLDMSFILITHDMGVVANVCDKVYVMYAGEILEHGEVRPLLKQPLHPYTAGLLDCILRLDRGKKDLTIMPGSVPDLANVPSGCAFHPRCPRATAECATSHPELFEAKEKHWARCRRYD